MGGGDSKPAKDAAANVAIKGQPHKAGFEPATYVKATSQREASTYETIHKPASP